MSEQSSGPFKNQDWGLRFRDKWSCKVTMDCVAGNAASIASIIAPHLGSTATSISGKTYRLVVDDSDPTNLGISIIEVT